MYYIDFDNTLYETGRLTKDILEAFANTIHDETGISKAEILTDIQNSFNSSTDNFMSFSAILATKYHIKQKLLQAQLNKIILTQGESYVFPDALEFLKKLKDIGEEACILTYVAQRKNIQQQAMKLTGSGILPYVTEVYTTTRYKYKLDIDYTKGTFIDDNPKDLEGLYFAGSRNIIRIKKPSNERRTSQTLNLPVEIPTYTSFHDIILEKNEILR